MNKSIVLVIALILVILGSIGSACATVLTFEDLPNNVVAYQIQDGYSGFNWHSGTQIGSVPSGGGYAGGYYATGTSGNISVFNYFGNSHTNIDLAGPNTFTFNGAQFTSAWSVQYLTFEGYNNGALVYRSDPFKISTTQPQWIELDWAGIDRLTILNTDCQWVMDNFTYDQSNSVPEPATFLLLGAGIAGFGILRRRFKK